MAAQSGALATEASNRLELCVRSSRRRAAVPYIKEHSHSDEGVRGELRAVSVPECRTVPRLAGASAISAANEMTR